MFLPFLLCRIFDCGTAFRWWVWRFWPLERPFLIWSHRSSWHVKDSVTWPFLLQLDPISSTSASGESVSHFFCCWPPPRRTERGRLLICRLRVCRRPGLLLGPGYMKSRSMETDGSIASAVLIHSSRRRPRRWWLICSLVFDDLKGGNVTMRCRTNAHNKITNIRPFLQPLLVSLPVQLSVPGRHWRIGPFFRPLPAIEIRGPRDLRYAAGADISFATG